MLSNFFGAVTGSGQTFGDPSPATCRRLLSPTVAPSPPPHITTETTQPSQPQCRCNTTTDLPPLPPPPSFRHQHRRHPVTISTVAPPPSPPPRRRRGLSTTLQKG
nr:hypothetical protein [Tanacetum cinerariifolium]